MQLHANLPAIIALVAGILILVRPLLLSLIVGAYLIIVGLLGLIGPAAREYECVVDLVALQIESATKALIHN